MTKPSPARLRLRQALAEDRSHRFECTYRRRGPDIFLTRTGPDGETRNYRAIFMAGFDVEEVDTADAPGDMLDEYLYNEILFHDSDLFTSTARWTWVEYRRLSSEFSGRGLFHRVGGPAIETSLGDQYWLRGGLLHREDGPALVEQGGRQEWHQDGHLHRIGGPAIVHANGHLEWWREGVRQPGPPPGRGAEVLSA